MQEKYLIGTYTRDNNSEGLYYLVVNTKTGLHKIVSSTERMIDNPIYVALNEDKDIIYSIVKDNQGGGIATLTLEQDKFSLYEEEWLDDFGACDIKLTPNEKFVLTGHYGAGKLVVQEVDGTVIEKITQIIDHKILEEENQTARVHFVQYMLDGHILVCDLGLDAIFSYPFNEETGFIDVSNVQKFKTKIGAGPRNLVVNSEQTMVYCINELSTTLDVFTYKDGGLSYVDTYNTIDEIIRDKNPALVSSGAAIKISTDGTRLYTSIRGNNVLVTYAVLANGGLERLAITATEGVHPRDFELSLDNSKLFVANQLSNNVTVFHLDENGIPEFTGESIEIPAPVHVYAF